jgi:hypothetical protein
VGQTLEATLLTLSNILPPGYGQIYRLLSGPLDNHKQYVVTIIDYLVYSCVDFFAKMSKSFSKQGLWCHVNTCTTFCNMPCMLGLENHSSITSWSWNEVHRLLDYAKVLDVN